MATHGDIGLSQPAASTITMKLRTVTQDLNSTVCHQEIMTLGGAESTLQIAQVLAGPAAPASTAYGLVTRAAAYVTDRDQSSQVAGVSNTLPVSSAYGLVTRTLGYVTDRDQSTQVAGVTNTLPASTAYGLVTRAMGYVTDRDQSSQVAAVLGTAPVSTTYGLAVRPVGGGVDYTHDAALTVSTVAGPACMFRGTSTRPPAASTSDDAVWGTADLRGRQLVSLASIFPTISNYVASSAGQSTLTQIVSSNADLATYVFAIQIATTAATQNTLEFYASSRATLLWNTRFSSAVMGYGIAVTPPAYLFKVSTGQNLALFMASTADHSVNVAYFLEP